jgi:hypothetical protein
MQRKQREARRREQERSGDSWRSFERHMHVIILGKRPAGLREQWVSARRIFGLHWATEFKDFQ